MARRSQTPRSPDLSKPHTSYLARCSKSQAGPSAPTRCGSWRTWCARSPTAPQRCGPRRSARASA